MRKYWKHFSNKTKSKADTLLNGENYLVFLEGVWESALPAAILEFLPVRPSRRTFDAAEAALFDVCLLF